MPLDPSEIPDVLRSLTEQNRRMADKLAPLREGKCPKCLTPLVVGEPADGWGRGQVCPACGWGRRQPPPASDPLGGGCGLCNG
jgi:hypothetical protein